MHNANCSFGVFKFVEDLAVITNTTNATFQGRPHIMFSCRSNVDAADKQWKIMNIPKNVNYSISSDATFIYLRTDVTNITKNTTIVVNCFVSFRDRNANKTITEYLAVSNDAEWNDRTDITVTCI